MLVYTIVVTYNGISWVDSCFGSFRNSEIPIHTIAIDNASSDGTAEKIRREYPEVELIENKTNIGFGQANNIGLKKVLKSEADYVFLMNQDAMIQADTIKGLVDIQIKNPEFDILSPIHLSEKDKVDSTFITNLNKNIVSELILNKKKSTLYEVEGMHAAIWLMTRKCIETVGGFDPIFLYRGEDNDYVERCKLNNIKIGVSLKYFAYHKGEGDREKEFNCNEIINRKYVENLVVLKTRYNKKLWKIFRRISVQLLGEMFKSVLNLNMKLLYVYNVVLFKLVIALPKINSSRMISIKQKKAFL